MKMKKKRKVLLIGWDAADWKFLNPLIDAGMMPNLQKLIEGGSMGKLATLDPPLSPTLWTSIATGKRPYQHGIHGFTEPDASGKSIRPIYITSRKVKAIWNIFTQHKLKTHVVGWWPSHPAEPINGTMVSNLYQRASGNLNEPWPMLKGTVHPAEKSKLFADLRVHPQELTGNHIHPFVPNLDKVDQSSDKRLFSISKTIADCSTIHAAATYIMENEEWDFMAVYYDAIDHFCHGFMKYHPPRRSHIPVKDYELYKDVVASGCRFHDMMLGRLMKLAGSDTTIMLVSDHGFHPDNNRPISIPNEPAGPAVEHSPFGVIIMKGEGIKKDASIFGASLLDITPTLLSLFDLPVAEDMDGKVLVSAFEKMPDIKTIQSWENIKGEDGSHPPNFKVDAGEAQAELQQLIELGYIKAPGDDADEAIKSTTDENNYNLARSYIDGAKWEKGIEILEKLHTANPKVLRFAGRLAHTYQSIGKFKDARRIVNHIRTIFDRENPQLDILEATLLLEEGRNKKALKLLQKIEKESGNLPQLNLRISKAYLQLNELEKAKKAVLKELAINKEEISAYYTLGLIYYKLMRYNDALDVFMDAVGLQFFNPLTHFQIGETLVALKEYESAIEAFDLCLMQAPSFNSARQRIIQVYEVSLGQAGKALKYKQSFHKKLQGDITIVSGLPRSGTSMLMQMLAAGGLDIYTDQKRKSDESNPKGYYEHESIKNLAKDKTFLKDISGKTVKIIANLLQDLPTTYRYHIVFIERDLYEIIGSQQKMLIRDGKRIQEDTLPLHLLKSYEKTIEEVKKWAKKMPNVRIHFVKHKKVLEAPFVEAMMINDFLGGALAVEKMAAVVDKKLYREKQNH